jgi:hypothetical protein
VYQRHRSHTEVPFSEVTTVEFEARKSAKPSLDFVEITLIDIHSNDPLRGRTVDLFQAVAARYPQYGDTLRRTAIESTLEEFRQDRQLPHACGAHVPFIVSEGYGEPRI